MEDIWLVWATCGEHEPYEYVVCWYPDQESAAQHANRLTEASKPFVREYVDAMDKLSFDFDAPPLDVDVISEIKARARASIGDPMWMGMEDTIYSALKVSRGG